MSTTTNQSITTIVFDCIQIPALIFLFIIIHPLYQVARERIALYILMSKTCAAVILQISQGIYRTTKFNLDITIPLVDFIYPYFSQSLYMTIYVHILGLAINRIFAIFFAFEYPRIWTKKNTTFFILVLWVIGIPMGILHVQILAISNNKINISPIIQWSITGFCGFLYGIMVIKFAFETILKRIKNSPSTSTSPNQQNLEKDRIRIFVICLVSVITVPLNQIFISILSIFPNGSIPWIVVSTLIIANLAIVNCIEQCTLIVFCVDFRVLIAEKFKRGGNRILIQMQKMCKLVGVLRNGTQNRTVPMTDSAMASSPRLLIKNVQV